VLHSARGENGSRVPASCENSSGGRTSRERRGGSVVGRGAAQRCDPRVQRGRGHGQRRWSAGGEETGEGKREGGKEMTCGPGYQREEKRRERAALGQGKNGADKRARVVRQRERRGKNKLGPALRELG
jgi:hypothetical protein